MRNQIRTLAAGFFLLVLSSMTPTGAVQGRNLALQANGALAEADLYYLRANPNSRQQAAASTDEKEL